MAIEFNCPYCTSTIRVPDDAAGKKGTCPRCETPILVPVVAMNSPSASDSSPASPAASSRRSAERATSSPVEFDVGDEPVFPGPPVSGSEFPLAPAFPGPSEPAPSYARALKRRRKKGGLGVVVPVLFGLGLIGVVVVLIVLNQPSLEGELTAEALPEFDKAAGGVGRADVADLPDQTVAYVLDELQDNPLRLTSGLMETEFRGTRAGIEVRVFEGTDTTFFRVDPRRNGDFDEWVRKNAEKLEVPRLKKLQAAAKRFFAEYRQTEGNLPDPASYRDPLGLNAAVSRVGYNMAAIVDGKAYRCVYEDGKQRLYFLLPRETKHFELAGRQLEGGETHFPGRYRVRVE